MRGAGLFLCPFSIPSMILCSHEELAMPTIVQYTDREGAVNRYPSKIVSPSRASACCFTDMEDLGEDQTEGRWIYRYRRCRTCGYAVRLVVRELPDSALIERLRKELATALTRNVPDY
jgi:hypothetical protein